MLISGAPHRLTSPPLPGCAGRSKNVSSEPRMTWCTPVMVTLSKPAACAGSAQLHVAHLFAAPLRAGTYTKPSLAPLKTIVVPVSAIAPFPSAFTNPLPARCRNGPVPVDAARSCRGNRVTGTACITIVAISRHIPDAAQRPADDFRLRGFLHPPQVLCGPRMTAASRSV